MKKCDLSFLLGDTHEVYYWLGFLFADGCFIKNRLVLSSAVKDKNHIKKLARKFKCKVYLSKDKKYCYISPMDTKVLKTIAHKYNISSRKTYEPCDISSVSGENLRCLSIGFIDGDGTIRNQTGRKDCFLGIKCHRSWYSNLEKLYPFAKGRINNQGYASFTVTRNSDIRKLKEDAIKFNLPILKRKWDKVDLKFVSKQELGQKRIFLVRELIQKNLSEKEISKKLGVTYNCIHQIVWKNKLRKRGTCLPETQQQNVG